MAKNIYIEPKLTVIDFDDEDILTASNEVGFELNDDFFNEGGY